MSLVYAVQVHSINVRCATIALSIGIYIPVHATTEPFAALFSTNRAFIGILAKRLR